MDLKNTINAASLLYQSLIKGKTGVEKIPFYPQKTYLPEVCRGDDLPRALPEKAGLSTKAVTAFVRALSSDREVNLHSLMLVSDGKVIAEAAAPGYDTLTPHMAFSFSKTITGLAIGLLIEEGKLSLSDTVISFFPEEKPFLVSKRMRALTVRHLLTMSSGVSFNEAGAVVEENWLQAFLSSSIRFEPGTSFAYNSMNSYVLSAIVKAVSGRSLTEYLKPRLFAPMGITRFFWEKCPRGIEKGGWGLYLSAVDMTKFGILLLNGGVYEGKQLISARWVREATRRQIKTNLPSGTFDYGYHLWVHRQDSCFLLNGMLGQNTLVYPQKRLILTMTAGEDTLFQDTPSLTLSMKLLQNMTVGKARRAPFFAVRKLRDAERKFRYDTAWLSPEPLLPFPAKAERDAEQNLKRVGIFGAYTAAPNSAGLLPLLIRLIQNNHTRGIRRLLLTEDGDEIFLTLDEGNVRALIRAAHRCYTETALSLRGEKYIVRAAYEWAMDENRTPVLKIHVVFPELCSERRFVFRQSDGAYFLSLSERPGFSFVEKLTDPEKNQLSENRFLDFVMDKIPVDVLLLRASAVFSPRIRLFPKKTDGNAKLLRQTLDKR